MAQHRSAGYLFAMDALRMEIGYPKGKSFLWQLLQESSGPMHSFLKEHPAPWWVSKKIMLLGSLQPWLE